MKKLSKNAIIGYPAGIITGITYGLNPLFAVPLMKNGAATESILFFRYAFAVLLLGLFLLLRKQSFRVSGKQIGVLFVLGLLYTSSSIFLFDAYELHRFRTGYYAGIPLPRPRGHYHGVPESRSLMAGMACHCRHLRRCAHHDTE